jgi:hypothetical protein
MACRQEGGIGLWELMRCDCGEKERNVMNAKRTDQTVPRLILMSMAGEVSASGIA